jgi:hypothetical protein
VIRLRGFIFSSIEGIGCGARSLFSVPVSRHLGAVNRCESVSAR